jgi:hypothetical protein
MKKLFASSFLLVLLSAGTHAQAKCTKPYSPERAIFTICPPDSLKIAEVGNGFNIYVHDLDPARNNFTVVMAQQETPGTLAEAAFGLTLATLNEKPRAILKEAGFFTTRSNVEGIRLVFEYITSDRGRMDRIDYFFARRRSSSKVVFSVIIPADSAADRAEAEALIKTVTIKK